MNIRSLINFLTYLITTSIAFFWLVIITCAILIFVFLQKFIYPDKINIVGIACIIMGTVGAAIFVTIPDYSLYRHKMELKSKF